MRAWFFLLFAGSLSLPAQSYKAKQIEFSQHGSFTQQQLEDCVRIHPGTVFNKDDLSAAAQRLSDSGYFEDVSGALGGSVNAITVKFDVKAVDHSRLIPVGFENFVWLTHDEIEAAIRARLPLFIDLLPEGSQSQDYIQAILTSALASKSITAQVAYSTLEPTLRHPVREIGFRIVKPSIRVSNVKLAGVNPGLVPFVQKSVNATVRTRYTEGPADETTTERILAPLLDAGYVEAILKDISVVPSPEENGVVNVVLNASLQPGEVFHLSKLNFAATPLISADTFAASARLHAGDIASRRLLLESFTGIDQVYRAQGYMDVVVNAAPSLDQATHEVAYAVSVVPGEQYHVRTVTAINLDPAAQADFDRGFLIKEGSLYNPRYVADFLKNNTALMALAHYSAGYKAVADPNTHTVQLTITFFRGAA